MLRGGNIVVTIVIKDDKGGPSVAYVLDWEIEAVKDEVVYAFPNIVHYRIEK